MRKTVSIKAGCYCLGTSVPNMLGFTDCSRGARVLTAVFTTVLRGLGIRFYTGAFTALGASFKAVFSRFWA